MKRSTRQVYADTFAVPRRGNHSSPLMNAVAILPGESDSLLVICAHLDATADRQSGWRKNWQTIAAPGATDNATGIAAMLEVLALAAHAPRRSHYTLMFIACNAEERNVEYANPRDHHLGSRHAAGKLKERGSRVKGVIAMDMVGYNPRENYLGLFASSRSQPMARELYELANRLRLKLALPGTFSSCNKSDNDSFERAGFPSLLFMESCMPWRASAHHQRNPGYHSSSDLPSAVSFTILEQLTRLVVAYVTKSR
jgi:leucyl aminopeptidase